MMDRKPAIDRDLAAHEARLHWEEARDRLRYSTEYAQSGLKSLFLANGGAIVGLLTFAGNGGAVIEPVAVWWSFIWFALGLVSVLSAFIAAYMSQSFIMQYEFYVSRQAMSYARDLEQDSDSDVWGRKGNLAVTIGVWLAVISLGFFVVGAFVALDAIT